MKSRIKKGDFIVIFVILVLVVISLIGVFYIKSNTGNNVTITCDGITYYTGSLMINDTIDITDENGNVTNSVCIENGYVYMKYANCPDHLCQKMGKINSSSQSIVCLPNRVVVSVSGRANDDRFDSIAGN